ncbi:MAG: toxin-activating lysine-acyltransferase [Gemmobacter sp.]|jgi:cytolysin-activating lysine-acyltransferase|nr:toxin-activating lysine-acyltransferase [Gemmobacter sp.]
MSKTPDVPTSEEFTRTLGQVTFLLTISRPHLERPIAHIRDMVIAPLMLKQVRVFLRGRQPVAALSWAYASDEIRERVAKPPFVMGLPDWRSGPHVTVVEVISPLLAPQMFIDQFLADAHAARDRASTTGRPQ